MRHENPWNIDLKWKEMNHYIIIHNFTRSLEIDLRLTVDMTWGSFSQDIINLNRLSLLWNRSNNWKILCREYQGFVIWSLQSIHNFETKYFTYLDLGGKHVPLIGPWNYQIFCLRNVHIWACEWFNYLVIVLEVHLVNSLVLDVGCPTGETGS